MPNTIVPVLEKLKESIPVVWDRFTKTDEGFYVVYGWIARTDGQRDFVLLEMWDGEDKGDSFCTTSSAKYSEEICRILYGSAEDHNPCRKIEELFQQPKGGKGGECKRTACNNQNAMWFNHSTKAYYCKSCAMEINFWNRADAMRLYGHELCTNEAVQTVK